MSIDVTLYQVAQWLGVVCEQDAQIKGVSTDTRNIKTGNLFVALSGERFDAHEFVQQAADQGAVAAVVERPVDASIPTLVVEDSLAALQALGKAWRLSLDLKVVAITGSNGKTSVKEMVASILRNEGKVGVTQGNLNNHIGVPLTLLSLSRDQQFAVVEMGANHQGEIALLTQLACPDVALITNIGNAHLEGFGSIEGIAKGKSEIYQGLKAGGVAIMKAGQHWSAGWKAQLPENISVVQFGKVADSDVRVHGTISSDGWHAVFETSKGQVNCVLPMLGQHNLCNAAAAVAATQAMGASARSIQKGLEKLMPVSGRLCLEDAAFGGVLIDDTYNANPSSFQAAINVLSDYDHRQKILVMGGMAELGEQSEELHAGVGAYALEMGVDVLLGVGEKAQAAVAEFGENGILMEDHCSAVRWLLDHAGDRTAVLVKGSRSAAMENVVHGVMAENEKMCGEA